MTGHRSVLPGTVQVWSDISCPWATLFVERLWAARSRLGLELDVRIDHHAFSLEHANGRAVPQAILDLEAQELTVLEPSLGWQPWRPDNGELWPTSFEPAMAAVQAAKLDQVGGLAASERLDLLLRRALFNESRPIDDRDEILTIARSAEGVDVTALARALDDGTGAAALARDAADVEALEIEASPHALLADGTSVVNPGILMPESDDGSLEQDPAAIDELLRSALTPQG